MYVLCLLSSSELRREWVGRKLFNEQRTMQPMPQLKDSGPKSPPTNNVSQGGGDPNVIH